jgi:hypothetical protein
LRRFGAMHTIALMSSARGQSSLMVSLRHCAMQQPGAEEGIACKGTALEARTIKIRGKAFLFLRTTEARLKLGASIKEAAAQASKNPASCIVGTNGWVLVKFEGNSIPINVLHNWVKESAQLLGGGKRPRAEL